MHWSHCLKLQLKSNTLSSTIQQNFLSLGIWHLRFWIMQLNYRWEERKLRVQTVCRLLVFKRLSDRRVGFFWQISANRKGNVNPKGWMIEWTCIFLFGKFVRGNLEWGSGDERGQEPLPYPPRLFATKASGGRSLCCCVWFLSPSSSSIFMNVMKFGSDWILGKGDLEVAGCPRPGPGLSTR